MEIFSQINIENRKCIYCNLDCHLECEGVGTVIPTYNVDILSCLHCNETFEVHYWQKSCDDIEKVAVLFSCRDIYTFCKDNHFTIGNSDLLWKKGKGIPYQDICPFEIDFSNKEKLYEKLKVYLIFS